MVVKFLRKFMLDDLFKDDDKMWCDILELSWVGPDLLDEKVETSGHD